MTDSEIIAIMAAEIAPHPCFREERRRRNGRPLDLKAMRDQDAIRTASNKAERILARLRERGIVP